MIEYKFNKENNKLIEKYCSGVYAIRNDLNNKMYIGSSSNIRNRYTYHLTSLLKNKGVNRSLQDDFNIVGANNFSFLILEECQDNINTIKFIESKYMDKYGFYNQNIVDGKPVHCYNMNGDYIQSFNNIKTAAKIFDVFADNIRQCCNGKKKSCCNLQWSYTKSNNIGPWKRKENYTGCKQILQLDLYGNIIRKFDSIGEASRITGLKKSCIQSVLCNKKPHHKTAGGYVWKYNQNRP